MASGNVRVSKKRMINFSGKTIKIYVGGDSFVVHQDLLKNVSPFFRSMLDRNKGQGTVSFSWEREDMEAVHLYFNWIYRRVIPSWGDGEQVRSKESLLLARAYHAGDFFEDRDFQDAIVDCVLQRATEGDCGKRTRPGPQAISYTYQHGQKDSKFRLLLVNLYASRALDGSFLKAESEEYPNTFLTEVLSAVADMQLGVRKRLTNGCGKEICDLYHNHASESECYKKSL
ncbi:hypothetical protein FQN49_004342 [Arthroderma sp. PD_2]|nr:hypothetical protein FQN49_004342 [Arthroderma sp. PD_2]